MIVLNLFAVYLLVLNFFVFINGQSWKPLVGQPTAFSISQTHPALGLSKKISGIINSVTENHSSIYQNEGYLDEQGLRTEPVFIGGEEVAGYSSLKPSKKSFIGSGFEEDTCSVDKYAFDHEGTIQYKHSMPKLDQLTLCLWMRFTNHSGDHTIFTYSVDESHREIQFWVANSKGSSFISMAIHGQSLYRLNYPLKMRMWHHACTSWNGKTGEWQLWVKGERVGRGFHNRIVGHIIKPGGYSYSGGSSITGDTADGLHFELTLLQLYSVALSAGKAHRDHKHHHVHHFDHNGPVVPTTQPPSPQPISSLTTNPLLANGQIPTRVKINLAGPASDQTKFSDIDDILSNSDEATISTNFVNGQFHTAERLLAQQLISSTGNFQTPKLTSTVTFPGAIIQTKVSPIFGQTKNPANVKYTLAAPGRHVLYKRDNINTDIDNNEKKITKRDLVMLRDGSVLDDTLLAHGYQFKGLAQYGLPNFKKHLKQQMDVEDEIKEHDKEPAEDEVKAVMDLCTSCDTEPFDDAVVINWNRIRVSRDHVLKGRSVGGCGNF